MSMRHGRRWRTGQSGRWRVWFAAAAVTAAAGTAVAAETSIWLRAEQVAAGLIGLAVLLLVVAYIGHAQVRDRYASLQSLYQFTEGITAAPDDEAMVSNLLTATVEVLDADIAELVLIDSAGRYQRYALRSRNGTTISRVERSAPPSLRAVANSPAGFLTRRESDDPVARRWLESMRSTEGMLVPLKRDAELVGTLAVLNRFNTADSFDEEKFRLFGTLASHAAISIENTHLIQKLSFEVSHDALTGLVNRQEFQVRLTAALNDRRPGRKVAVALIDLDRFKEINDTLGHHTGDELLAWLGRRIAANLPERAAAARLGGDEFAIAVEFDGTKFDAVTVVRSMLEPLWKEPFHFAKGNVNVDVSGSTGVAVAPDDADDAATLLQRADVAMYSAKRNGGTSNVAAYRAERDTHSAQKLALVSELRTALTDRALDVHFQPQVDLETGLIVSAEALVRWEHPQRGWLSPEEFIPLAERTGLIVPLTEFVLDRALRARSLWQRGGIELSVAVNLSVRSLGDGHIVDTVQHLLRSHSLGPELLTLEITESGVMEDERRNIGILEALAQLGARIAIDDFGTGYSSLAYLKSLPAHEVKIDRSFVMAMDESPQDMAIVRSVIELAHNLDLAVVAEGVETATALAALVRLGCTTVQGFHIGKPVPAPVLLATTRDWNSRPHPSLTGETRPGPRALLKAV